MSTRTLTLEEKQPSCGTLHGLDWLNFFLADVQTGVGRFLRFTLLAISGMSNSLEWYKRRLKNVTVGGVVLKCDIL